MILKTRTIRRYFEDSDQFNAYATVILDFINFIMVRKHLDWK